MRDLRSRRPSLASWSVGVAREAQPRRSNPSTLAFGVPTCDEGTIRSRACDRTRGEPSAAQRRAFPPSITIYIWICQRICIYLQARTCIRRYMGLAFSRCRSLQVRPQKQSHGVRMRLPKYAQAAVRSRLVRFFCKTGCRSTRYGEASKSSWDVTDVRIDPDLYVTCLKCGGRQPDKSNWTRVI